jgi:hypothetical protein
MGQTGEMGRRDVACGALPPGKTARRPHFASLTHPQGGAGRPVSALGSLASYRQVAGLRSLTRHGPPGAVPNAPPIEFKP